MESMLNKETFYSKSFVIFIRHPEMLKLDGTPCTTELSIAKNNRKQILLETNEQIVF
jgi:hypothetical protein